MSSADITGKWKDCNSAVSKPSVYPTELKAADIAASPPELVTIQAGADDIDFAGCLEYALGAPGIVGGVKCNEGNSVTPAIASRLARVTSALERTISSIETESKGTTKIAVVNYYLPIPAPSVFRSDGSQLCTLLDAHKSGAYHDAEVIQSALNAAIVKAVAASPGVKLVDIGSLLGGPGTGREAHQMCTAHPWLFTGSELDGQFWRAVHPTAAGQAAIAVAVEAVVGPA
jgi:lysophospholipase L1-like esterase